MKDHRQEERKSWATTYHTPISTVHLIKESAYILREHRRTVLLEDACTNVTPSEETIMDSTPRCQNNPTSKQLPYTWLKDTKENTFVTNLKKVSSKKQKNLMIGSSKASWVAQWVKVFGTQPDDLSSIPESPVE